MSVDIQINDKYKITTDDYQWMVCVKEKQKDKKTGEMVDYWRPRTYHPNLGMALKSLSNRLLRESDATTWEQLCGNARDIVSLLREPFPSISIAVKEKGLTTEVKQ